MEQNLSSKTVQKFTKTKSAILFGFIGFCILVSFTILIILLSRDLIPSLGNPFTPTVDIKATVTITPDPADTADIKTYNYFDPNSELNISFDYPETAKVNSGAREYNVTIDHIIQLINGEEILVDLNGAEENSVDAELKFKMDDYYRIDPENPETPLKLNSNPDYKFTLLKTGVNLRGSKYSQFSIDAKYLVTIFEFPDQNGGSWYIYLSVNTLNPSGDYRLIFDSVRVNK